jgi:hypothetical protein
MTKVGWIFVVIFLQELEQQEQLIPGKTKIPLPDGKIDFIFFPKAALFST